ncbi:MAG: hypothetical protein IJM50_03775 [Lachnospiraceae bacterium]|nr:hypothetical protein [Lachnospiraceae bacterium]
MEQVYKDYLFNKHILVNDLGPEEHTAEVWFALANLLEIRVSKGRENLNRAMIPYAQEKLGANVPKPFYLGFPQTVRELTPDKLLFDQIVHYSVTYGFGNFDEPGHSLMEEQFERLAFKENARILDFEAVSEEEAEKRLFEAVRDLASGTRPLSRTNFDLLLAFVKEHGTNGLSFASQDTKIRLLCGTKDLSIAKGLHLSDVLKVTERLYFDRYMETNWTARDFSIKKLNLKNQERRFLTALLRLKLNEEEDFRNCYEKQAVWCGFLHHIHFLPLTEKEARFADAMRSGRNASVYAETEALIAKGDPDGALWTLYKEKGAGAVLRQANYLMSRGASAEAVAACAKESGSVLLLQLLSQYETYEAFGSRTFTFTHLEMLTSHTETDKERGRRRSYVPEEKRSELTCALRSELTERWKGKLGKVYVSEELKKTALPVSESSSQGGFGVLPKGTRLTLPEGKKLRAFTYWEKVNDIDLSVIGLDRQNRQHEFSWRTMSSNQSDAITYSGDQTSGFKGGSEFFDIDLPAFREAHPDIRYMIFCDNIYSRNIGFDGCVCRAGYMLRDTEDSGEVFEPKTVLSSYTINCPASYAFLFALDLEKSEFVWLNAAVNSSAPVAGDTNVSMLNRLFKATDIMSLYDLLTLQASSLTDDPKEADVVATDVAVDAREDALRIHSYDIDVMLRLIESR